MGGGVLLVKLGVLISEYCEFASERLVFYRYFFQFAERFKLLSLVGFQKWAGLLHAVSFPSWLWGSVLSVIYPDGVPITGYLVGLGFGFLVCFFYRLAVFARSLACFNFSFELVVLFPVVGLHVNRVSGVHGFSFLSVVAGCVWIASGYQLANCAGRACLFIVYVSHISGTLRVFAVLVVCSSFLFLWCVSCSVRVTN